jgi:hypothetical protein
VTVWPNNKEPANDTLVPGVVYEPGEPLFAQYRVDARLVSAEHGKAGINLLVDHLSAQIQQFLARK